MGRSRLWFFVLAFLVFSLSACSEDYQAPDHGAARAGVVLNDLVRFKPISELGSRAPLAVFGPALLGTTTFVPAKESCEGAAGSVIPPLGIVCAASTILLPFNVFANVTGQQTIGRTIGLRGLQNYWVSQKESDLCWAASLEIARSYLHLRHVGFENMISMVSRQCPKLLHQGGRAQLYQIGAVSEYLRSMFHEGSRGYACNDERCIISALQRGHPIIALLSSHAVVIQAVGIALGTSDLIQKFYVVDPAGEGEISEIDPIEMCKADAFLVI